MSSPLSFATVAGNRIAYRLEGRERAPVLVLASSLGTTNEIFDAELPALASRLRVLRYDLRGHGASAAPEGPYSVEMLGQDLLGLLDHLGIERASICGLSLGGMIGMWVGANRPERLERLVLACTAPVFPPPDSWAARAAAVRAAGVGSLTEVVFPRWFTEDFRNRRPDVLASVAAMLDSCDAEGYAACCEAIAKTDLSADLARIEAPTLVVAGAEDPASPPSRCLEMAQAIEAGRGSATLVVLAGAAHLANLAHPQRFADLVLDHLLGPVAERGMAVRRAVLGDAHVDRAGATGGFGELYQDFITRYAWGEVWARPGLDRRTRSAITVAMLVALGRFEELAFHLPAALRNGWSVAELEEILLQSAVYAGVPAAQRAFHVAREALAGDGSAFGSGETSGGEPRTGEPPTGEPPTGEPRSGESSRSGESPPSGGTAR